MMTTWMKKNNNYTKGAYRGWLAIESERESIDGKNIACVHERKRVKINRPDMMSTFVKCSHRRVQEPTFPPAKTQVFSRNAHGGPVSKNSAEKTHILQKETTAHLSQALFTGF